MLGDGQSVHQSFGRAAIALLMLVASLTVSAEERWQFYFHAVDKDNAGNIVEALDVLKIKPNYLCQYIYEGNRLLARRMSYFVGRQTRPLDGVLYSYDKDGSILSTGYFAWNLTGQRTVRFTKVYSGANYTIFDATPPRPDDRVTNKLRRIEARLEELKRLEKRGLLRRIFGGE